MLPLADLIMDVEPTGNRVDLLSVYGIAREVAALFGVELAPPPGVDPEPRGTESVDIRIDDLEGCPRYVGRTFGDVRVGPSPPWLRARLTGAGMRPISNVVDVTNYVMLALGNPLHAFDRTSLAGDRIVVRRATRGEKLRTLDGVERELDERDLVIADAERAIALAGIMGGEETEVRDSSTEILLEAANFEPFGLLRSSERLKLRTRGLEPLGEGRRSVSRAAGGVVRHAAARRARRRPLARPQRRPRRAAAPPRRPAPACARRRADRARDASRTSSAAILTRLRLRGRRRLERDGPHVAKPAT